MIEEIRAAISNDKIDDAIDLISQLGNEVETSQAVILKNKWKSLQSKFMIGTITQEQYSTRKTKFCESILWLVDPESNHIGKIIEELEDVRNENEELRAEVNFHVLKENNYNGYTYDELHDILSQTKIPIYKTIQDTWFFLMFPNTSKELANYRGLDDRAFSRQPSRDMDRTPELLFEIDLNDVILISRMNFYQRATHNMREFVRRFGSLVDTGLVDLHATNQMEREINPTFTTIGMKYLRELMRRKELFIRKAQSQ